MFDIDKPVTYRTVPAAGLIILYDVRVGSERQKGHTSGRHDDDSQQHSDKKTKQNSNKKGKKRRW